MATATHDLRRIDPRTTVRLSGVASAAAALAVLALAGSLVSAGLRPGVVLAVLGVLVVSALDALGIATRRRIARTHVLTFALTDAILGAGAIALAVAGPDALTLLERAALAGIGASFGWLSIAGIRAVRILPA